MNEIEQEPPRVLVPGRLHDLLALEHERDILLPLRRGEAAQLLGNAVVVAIVRVEDLTHGWGRGRVDPLEHTLLESLAEKDLLAHHQPRDLTRVARFLIRAVI